LRKFPQQVGNMLSDNALVLLAFFATVHSSDSLDHTDINNCMVASISNYLGSWILRARSWPRWWNWTTTA
jgi:hypothetical protein